MKDWRETLCGTVSLRPVCTNKKNSLNLETLRGMSDAMSCGGMYIPNWQSRFVPTETSEVKNIRFAHLIGKKSGSLLMLSSQMQDDIRTPTLQFEQYNSSNEDILQEIGALWNKN